MITLKVLLPATEEPGLVAFLKTWEPKTAQAPSQGDVVMMGNEKLVG